ASQRQVKSTGGERNQIPVECFSHGRREGETVAADRALRSPGRRRWSRGDIQPLEPPAISAEDWHDPVAVLGRLRSWAQQHTTEAIRWHLRDKQAKRAGSRLLRAAAVILAVAGGLIPLLAGDAGRGPNPKLGYLLLALSAGAVAFDHFFGLSAGWM